jgi:branched-chain amino acid transport system substrate-binding protein
VVCDDSGDYQEEARHLTEDVGVPAVIGLYSHPVELAGSMFVPHSVLTMMTFSQSSLITTIPHAPQQPRMVFRTTYSNAFTANALAAMVSRTESDLRRRGVLGAGQPLRVALVRPKEQRNIAFAEKLFAVLTFNGKSALNNGSAYLERTTDDTRPLDDVVREVTAFAPHVVIAVTQEVVAPIEQSTAASARFRPTYLLNTIFVQSMLDFLGNDSDRRRRLFGLTTVSTTNANARLVFHYNETFPEAITRTVSPNTTYDAAYLVAYATYSLGGAPVTGDALARAIGRFIPPGTPVDVGPSGISGTYNALARGEGIDLNGTTGPLDFDLTTGEAPVALAIVCGDVDGKGNVVGNAESGLVYSAQSGLLEGELSCH